MIKKEVGKASGGSKDNSMPPKENPISKKLLLESIIKKIDYYTSKNSVSDIDLYYLIKDFFREFLNLKYEFSLDELSSELDKIYLDTTQREKALEFINKIKTIEYHDSSFSEEEIRKFIKEFSAITKLLIKNVDNENANFWSKLKSSFVKKHETNTANEAKTLQNVEPNEHIDIPVPAIDLEENKTPEPAEEKSENTEETAYKKPINKSTEKSSEHIPKAKPKKEKDDSESDNNSTAQEIMNAKEEKVKEKAPEETAKKETTKDSANKDSKSRNNDWTSDITVEQKIAKEAEKNKSVWVEPISKVVLPKKTEDKKNNNEKEEQSTTIKPEHKKEEPSVQKRHELKPKEQKTEVVKILKTKETKKEARIKESANKKIITDVKQEESEAPVIPIMQATDSSDNLPEKTETKPVETSSISSKPEKKGLFSNLFKRKEKSKKPFNTNEVKTELPEIPAVPSLTDATDEETKENNNTRSIKDKIATKKNKSPTAKKTKAVKQKISKKAKTPPKKKEGKVKKQENKTNKAAKKQKQKKVQSKKSPAIIKKDIKKNQQKLKPSQKEITPKKESTPAASEIDNLIAKTKKTNKKAELMSLYKKINAIYDSEDVKLQAHHYKEIMNLYKRLSKLK
jgi:hypothetical protein